MSAPPPGNYFIYNNKLSSAGDKLAVTWNGKIDDPVTVEKLVSSDTTQIVCSPPSLLSMCMSLIISIDYYHDLQWIVDEVTSMNEVPVSPLNAPELRASWGNGVVTVSDVPNSVWNVIQADDAYAYVTSAS